MTPFEAFPILSSIMAKYRDNQLTDEQALIALNEMIKDTVGLDFTVNISLLRNWAGKDLPTSTKETSNEEEESSYDEDISYEEEV